MPANALVRRLWLTFTLRAGAAVLPVEVLLLLAIFVPLVHARPQLIAGGLIGFLPHLAVPFVHHSTVVDLQFITAPFFHLCVKVRQVMYGNRPFASADYDLCLAPLAFPHVANPKLIRFPQRSVLFAGPRTVHRWHAFNESEAVLFRPVKSLTANADRFHLSRHSIFFGALDDAPTFFRRWQCAPNPFGHCL